MTAREHCQESGGVCARCVACCVCYPRGPGPRPVVCCSCPDAEELIEEANGLELDLLWPQPSPTATLPEMIELRREYTQPQSSSSGWYACSLNSLFTAAKVLPRWNAREALDLLPSAHLLVTGNARDELLDALWQRRHFGAFDALRAFAPALVCSPDYSCYGEEPYLEQLLNQKRSLLIAQLLYGLGLIPVVTMLWSVDTLLIRRWVNWLNGFLGQQQHTVCVNAQLIYRGKPWERWLAALALLHDAVERELNWIVCGVVKPAKRAQVSAVLGPNVTFVAATGLMAQFGRGFGPVSLSELSCSVCDRARAKERAKAGPVPASEEREQEQLLAHGEALGLV